ncbi:MAG: hypothetical protein C4326_01270 [Ignavibacteria bacterium]
MPDFSLTMLVPLIAGIILLFIGRKVFWLFVGGVVFLLVMDLAPRFVHHRESMIFYVALGAGLLAAAAGYFFQKVALRVVGLVAGGFFAFSASEQFMRSIALPWWVPVLVGALLGWMILSFLVEWALIVLSSLTGGFLSAGALHLESHSLLIVTIVLAAIGIIVQARNKRGNTKDG